MVRCCEWSDEKNDGRRGREGTAGRGDCLTARKGEKGKAGLGDCRTAREKERPAAWNGENYRF